MTIKGPRGPHFGLQLQLNCYGIKSSFTVLKVAAVAFQMILPQILMQSFCEYIDKTDARCVSLRHNDWPGRRIQRSSVKNLVVSSGGDYNQRSTAQLTLC